MAKQEVLHALRVFAERVPILTFRTCHRTGEEKERQMVEKEKRERLKRYLALKMENENRLDKLARLKSNAELPPMRGGDEAQHTAPSGDKLPRSVEEYTAYEEKIAPLIRANQREMETIEKAIAAVQDPMEREVLRLRYLDADFTKLLYWKDVARAIYKKDDKNSVDAVIRLHTRALSSVRFEKKT